MSFESFLLVFLDKTVNPPGTLPLSPCQGRCDKRHISVSQVQEVACHQPAYHSVVLINRVYGDRLFFVADDNQRNPACQFLHSLLKSDWIAGINDSLWFYVSDHPQIPLFQSGISLRIADKNAVALLVCYRFNTLKQKDIVRTGKSRTKTTISFSFLPLFLCLR